MLNARPAHKRLVLCDSYARTEQLFLVLLAEHDPRRRLALFIEWWDMCDAPWPYRSLLAEVLRDARRRIALTEVLEPPALEWFNALPEQVAIFRGCEFGRERGLSWTTDIQVARGFAIGKRCSNAVPTLVSAVIPKHHILAICLDRKESEVVVDFRRLRQLKSQRLTSASGAARTDAGDAASPE